MGVLDRLTRRADGARRLSLVAVDRDTAGGATPVGVPLMPLALRAGAVTALVRADRRSGATTDVMTAVLAAVQDAQPAAAQAPAPAAPAAAAPRATGGYAVLDVVTSGMSPEHDRVLEVAVVQLDDEGAVVAEWTTLLRPAVGSSAATGTADLVELARAVGVTLDELATAPVLADVAAELLDALAGRVLVAHGAAADLAFLRAELAALGVELPAAPVLCTLEQSWRHLPSLHRRRLADCCRAAGVALDGVPTALTDARAAAGLLQRFLARAGERGEAQGSLVARAAEVSWPRPALPPLSTAAPRRGAQPSLAGEPGRLANVLEGLPLDGPGLPLPAVALHVELLAQALAAGPLDDDAARALALLADAANLTRAQVRAASRGVLLALATAVGREPEAGVDEHAELLTAARTLGVREDDVLAALTAAVVATGSMPTVTVGVGASSRREEAPGQLTEALSLASTAVARVPSPREARPAPAEQAGPVGQAPLDLTDADARAAVRAWARENGFTVSDRGRLPRAVVDAFASTHPAGLTGLAAAR